MISFYNDQGGFETLGKKNLYIDRSISHFFILFNIFNHYLIFFDRI